MRRERYDVSKALRVGKVVVRIVSRLELAATPVEGAAGVYLQGVKRPCAILVGSGSGRTAYSLEGHALDDATLAQMGLSPDILEPENEA